MKLIFFVCKFQKQKNRLKMRKKNYAVLRIQIGQKIQNSFQKILNLRKYKVNFLFVEYCILFYFLMLRRMIKLFFLLFFRAALQLITSSRSLSWKSALPTTRRGRPVTRKLCPEENGPTQLWPSFWLYGIAQDCHFTFWTSLMCSW